MLDRIKGHRWLALPAMLAFPATFMAWGAGPLGGANYTAVATIVAPLLLACAVFLLLALEEKSLFDYIPLGCATFIYLVALGEMTKLCPCGIEPPPRNPEVFRQLDMGMYNMHNCFTYTVPLMAIAFASMVLPPYSQKTFRYRFAVFVAAFMPFMVLSFASMSIGYHD